MSTSVLLYVFLLLLIAGAIPPSVAQQVDPHVVDSLIDVGRQHYFRHDYSGATSQYSKALELAPQNPTALYELAWAWFEMQEYPQSLEAASQGALYTSGKLMDQLYALISMNYYHTMTVAVYELELSERTEEEVATFRKIAHTAPDGDERLFNLGLTYVTRSQLESASTAFVEALQVRPDYSECHWELGKCLDSRAELSLSVLAYAQAVLSAPDGVFTERILAMMENCLVRSNHDTVTVHTLPTGTPEALARSLESLIPMPTKNLSVADSMVTAYYLPWYQEMKAKGYTEVFSNYLYSLVDNPQASAWIVHNQKRLNEFLTWATGFQWPTGPVMTNDPSASPIKN